MSSGSHSEVHNDLSVIGRSGTLWVLESASLRVRGGPGVGVASSVSRTVGLDVGVDLNESFADDDPAVVTAHIDQEGVGVDVAASQF
jgi:hypothetical protein